MSVMTNPNDTGVASTDEVSSTVSLQTLAPKFDSTKHGIYFAALESGILLSDNLNIALSGGYGVGKSSVLQKFSERHENEVVEVSFSGIRADLNTMAPPGGEVNPASTTKTNQIQKEIVKQLLYRERPANTPASKYRRPDTFQWKRELAGSAVFGFALTIFAYLSGLLDRPLAAFAPGRVASIVLLIILAILVIALLFSSRRLFHNRVIIEKLSAGPATIALSPQSTTFFDEYLDEIVYFFQASRRRFVLFEDLDRFDDYEIFQSLRALNTLLNRSAQLTAKPVVFIYAVRDSLFEAPTKSDVDAAEKEVELANRTKFFDLVIPMVPFVSSRNARDLMMGEIARRGFTISAELVDLAAQHVADMRLILNVMNEYAIFDAVLVPGSTRAPSLTPDKLFALVLYKNIHLRDFELIRVGRSDLDTAYERYREFVSAATSRASDRATQLQASRVFANEMSQRAAQYGEAVVRYLEVTTEGLDLSSSYPNQISLAGRVILPSELSLPATWNEISSKQIGLDLVLSAGYQNQALTLSFSALKRMTGSRLDASEWVPTNDPAMAANHSASLDEARQTAYMSMQDLYARKDVVLAYGDIDDYLENFEDSVERLLKSKLARSLLREGYIDEYFALYAAQYHASRVSENAMNFLMRRVDRGISDATYRLSHDDAEAVLRERPDVVHDKAVLNVDLVDYILHRKLESSEIIRQLTSRDDDVTQFLQYFFETANSRTELIAALAKNWNGLLVYLTSTLEADEATRLELFSSATRFLSNSMRYETNEDVAAYLQANASELPFLTDENSSDPGSAIQLLLDVGTRIQDVDALSRKIRQAVIANDAFELSESNLVKIIGQRDVSLDNLLTFDVGLYRYATGEIAEYLEVQRTSRSTPYAVRQSSVLSRTLSEVGHTRHVDDLLNQSAQTIRIPSLSGLPTATWPALARARMIRPNARNVHEYFEEFGWDDPVLSLVRHRRTLDNTDELPQPDRHSLAVALLPAEGLSLVFRAQLVKKLVGNTLLAPSDVPITSPDLFGLLLRKASLPDTADTFLASKGVTWKARESLIAASKNFPDYVIPSMLTSIEVGLIASSSAIASASKSFIYDDLAAYTKGQRLAGLIHVAAHAQKNNLFLDSADVVLLVQRGLRSDWALALVWTGLSRRSLVEIEAVLTALGGKYAQLVAHSNKRPSFKRDLWNERLLTYLTENGKVNKFDTAHWDNAYVVANMKP